MWKKSLENPVTELSEDCWSGILSHTSPLDAARFAVLSKRSKSAADSDIVWEKFVPMEFVSRSVSPPLVCYGSKKELYFSLYNSPILLDDGNLSFSLVRKTGKKCFMVGAKGLIISWGDNFDYWEWTSHADPRFSEVAQLKIVWWLDIRGKIKTDVLSQKTRYKAYMIFTLENASGLDLVMNAVVRRVNFVADELAEERTNKLDLYQKPARDRCMISWQTQQSVQREDRWMEIKLGEFYNYRGDDGEVEARVMEIRSLNENSGLVVEGIELHLGLKSLLKVWSSCWCIEFLPWTPLSISILRLIRNDHF